MTSFMVKFFSYKPHSLSCLQSDPKKTPSYLEHSLSTWWDLLFLRPFAASDLHDPAGAAPPGTCRSRHPPHAPSESQGGSCSERVWRDEAAAAGHGASGSLGNSAGPCDPAPPGHSWWKSRVRHRTKWPCRKKKDWVHLRWCHTWVPLLLPRRYSTNALSDLNEGHWLGNKKVGRGKTTKSAEKWNCCSLYPLKLSNLINKIIERNNYIKKSNYLEAIFTKQLKLLTPKSLMRPHSQLCSSGKVSHRVSVL